MAYAGIDTAFFPGLATMRDLRLVLRPAWTGYYLRAPSHPDPGWMGQRAALVSLGYGMLPIWVGEEAYGPGAHQVDTAHGASEGADAVRLMVGEGFPAGSYCWLDVEGGGPVTPALRDYILAFAHALAGGGFGVGLYGSHLIAGALAALIPGARIWAVHTALAVTPHPYKGATLTRGTCGGWSTPTATARA